MGTFQIAGVMAATEFFRNLAVNLAGVRLTTPIPRLLPITLPCWLGLQGRFRQIGAALGGSLLVRQGNHCLSHGYGHPFPQWQAANFLFSQTHPVPRVSPGNGPPQSHGSRARPRKSLQFCLGNPLQGDQHNFVSVSMHSELLPAAQHHALCKRINLRSK